MFKKPLIALIAVASWLSFNTAHADSRSVVWLSADQKSAFLQEMREFMSASQQILEASLADDMTRVEKAAREVGIKMINNTPASLKAKLPPGMMKLGPATHKAFEDIANEAETLGDKNEILHKLATLQKTVLPAIKPIRLRLAR
jgi:hypothetical protein